MRSEANVVECDVVLIDWMKSLMPAMMLVCPRELTSGNRNEVFAAVRSTVAMSSD
jgi:hypothetical protein